MSNRKALSTSDRCSCRSVQWTQSADGLVNISLKLKLTRKVTADCKAHVREDVEQLLERGQLDEELLHHLTECLEDRVVVNARQVEAARTNTYAN